MISRSRLVALLLTGAVCVSVVGIMGSVGSAAATGTGTDYVTPGAGNPDTALTVNTNGFCPTGNTNFDVQVSGAGVTTHPFIYGNSVLPTAGAAGFSVTVAQTLSQFASEQSPAATISGAYEFDFNCLASSTALSPDYVFVGTIRFQGSGNGSSNTYTNTATTVAASPSGSAPFGSNVTLTATLSPANAAGEVQFMDGKSKLGAPVKVSGGKAVYKTSILAVGSHNVTATFGPLPEDTSGTWGPSTSAVLRYAMTTPAPVLLPTVWGTVKVGSTVDCVQAVAYATRTSWSWYENAHKIAGATQPQYKIPSSLKGKSLACELSATNRAGTTAETSTAVKVHPA
ncbi:MAG: Ig-like domain-containing protein [Acidimicrobiales bacterium]|jgi:hypothetical protein